MAKRNGAFNPNSFLSTSGPGRQLLSIGKGQTIFAEGGNADAVFVILKGRVRLSARSQGNKEAVLDILSEKDFAGKGCIAGEQFRTTSAKAITNCTVLRIESETMMRAMAQEVSLSNLLCAYVLKRNTRYQQDLVDHRCSTSEKRLARILLSFAKFDGLTTDDAVVPNLSHATIAKMVGTTRSRVCFFMKRFRESGFIDYRHPREPIRIHRSLIDFQAQTQPTLE